MVNGEGKIENGELLGMVGPFRGLNDADKQLDQFFAVPPFSILHYPFFINRIRPVKSSCINPCLIWLALARSCSRDSMRASASLNASAIYIAHGHACGP